MASAKSESDRAAAEASLLSAKRYQTMVVEQKKRAEEEAQQQKEWEELRRRGDEERAKAQEERERQRAEKAAAGEQAAKVAVPASAPAGASVSVPVNRVIQMEGQVLSVNCTPPYVMELILTAGGKQYKFRSNNFYKVQFWALGISGKNSFQPCTELKGHLVQVGFSEAPGKGYRGDLVSISVKR
jgi:hypothetical protein